MSSARSLVPEENFLCSICLSVFNKPASTPCGHNFCLDCITNFWETKHTAVKCPLCNETFDSIPKLRVNTVIAEMAAKLKRAVQENPPTTTEQAGNGNVLCGVCQGAKLKALKSCLVCFVSYCEAHLEPHTKISALKKHKLIHPVENLESRICKTHDEPLEFFCGVDHMFICGSCKDSDHKSHKTVTVEEEAQMKRTQLGIDMNDTDQMIRVRQQKIQEIQDSVEASRNNAAKALSYSMPVMTAVVEYIKKSQAELTEVIETKKKKIETEAEGFIKELEEEIMQIKQKNLQLNQVSVANDPFIFLENFLSLTITPRQVKDWSDVTLNSNVYAMEGAMTKLVTSVKREISMLCDPDLKKMEQHAVDVTLDPDTANPWLIVSEDGKQVTHGDRKRNLPNKPERFDHVLNVLAKEGFSSGKFYYEVQVKEKTHWDLGVAKESINRKGDIRLSPQNGYWTILLKKGHGFTANAGPAINLHVREMPQKIGVFVDYEEGQVSFYNVDSRAKIFSFTGCNFTEKLFPFFSPCANDGGKNSAPLIITPIKHNS